MTDAQLAAVVSAAKNTGVVTVDVSALNVVDSATIPGKVVKAGEDASKLTVWYIKDDGTIENKGGRFLFG